MDSKNNYEKRSFTKYVNGETTIAAFAKIIVQIAKPMKISQTLSEDIVHMVRIHYKAIESCKNELGLNK